MVAPAARISDQSSEREALPGFSMALMDHFDPTEWAMYRPGQEVKCPSTTTVRRDDRRGGPRVDSPSIWRPNLILAPPEDHIRRLRWQPGEQSVPGPRRCFGKIMRAEPGTFAWVRVCPVDRSTVPARYRPPKAPDECTQHVIICQDCGWLLVVCSAPAQVLAEAG